MMKREPEDDRRGWDPVASARRFFKTGETRTVKAKRNILGLFALRGLAIATNFLLVPLTLHYLQPTQYGLWLTLSSILTWVGFLDIGLGNGMRNKIAEAIARSDTHLAQEYVSTTYVSVGLIATLSLVLFWSVNPFLPWAAILNASSDLEPELRRLALAVGTFFCLRLVFQLIGSVLIANQRPAVSSALDVLVGVLSLLAVFLLSLNVPGSLYLLGLSVSALSALVPLAASFWFFGGKYRRYRPTIRAVAFGRSRELMRLGGQFFVLQMVGLVLFASPNLVITQLFGPAEVTPYNIALKYFGFATMGFMVILAPFWSAYTDAYVRGDLSWIRRTIALLRRLWLLLAAAVVLMLLAADWAYRIWVGTIVQIPFSLSLVMGVYVLVYTWSSIYVNLINGTGKIRLQLWNGVILALCVIPLSYLLAKPFGLGNTGVILATCLCLFPGCILWPIQTRRLLAGTARGIWNQ